MLGIYLMFNRNCGEALELYAKAFGVEVLEEQRYRDMPPDPNFPVLEEDKNLVLHSRMVIEGVEIMCADASNGEEKGSNMYVSLTMADEVLVEKAWDILKVNGTIYMDLQPSFFAKAHGSLQDKFGINWMFTALK